MKQGWIETGLGEICEVLDTKRKPITKEQTLKGPDKKVWHFFKGEKWEWKI